MSSGEQLHLLQGHEGYVSQVEFSPNGDRIVSSGADGTVRLWDVSSGKQLHLLQGHEGSVDQVEFSPNGDRIVSRGEDGTTRIWNDRGNQIAEYQGRGILNSDWTRIALVQDPTPLNPAPGRVIAVLPVDDLEGLIARACTKLHWFLVQSPTVSDSDRALCGIPPRE